MPTLKMKITYKVNPYLNSLLWVLSILAPLIPVSQEPSPQLRIEPEEMDFGEVFAGESPVKKLTIRNLGSDDVLLEHVVFNCGCNLSKIVLPSGESKVPDPKSLEPLGTLKSDESAEIFIEFDTLGLLGEMKRRLELITSVTKEKPLTVKMKITVKKPFTLEPEFLDLGDLRKGSTVSRSFMIRSAGVGDFKILGVSGLPSDMECKVEKAEGDTHRAYRIVLTLHAGKGTGHRRHRIRLNVQNEKVKSFDFYVTAQVVPEIAFRLKPAGPSESLDFGRMKKNAGAEGEIEIINENLDIPMEITGVRILCKHREFIDVRYRTEEGGKRFKVIVAVKPGLDVRFLQGAVIVSSTHPDMRAKKFKFTGWIEEE